MQAMASQRSLVRLLVLCLLWGACVAAKRRYLSVSMDELLSSKAHLDCPPYRKSVTTSGDKLPVPSACGLPPKCCGTGDSFGRRVFNHDMNRLSTLLRRSSVSSAAAAPAPSAYPPVPWIPFHQSPKPSPAVPPVAPPAEAPSVTIPDSSGTPLDSAEFVVTVGFGTPARTSTVIIDTGSDLSWIQCQPCSGHCYKQHDPIFDPTKSATYSALPCGHPQCVAAGGKCSNGTCLYGVRYGDGSSTSGVLSVEKLSLTSTRALHGFAFGCGERNLGLFGDVDGLIGLGRGELSLASQAAATLGATFSYCLPSYNGTHGFLTVGSKQPVSNQTQYTAMLQKPQYSSSFYFVELVSIDIGGYILPVPPTVFTKGGTLLDSGTTLTYLPTEAYTALRDRFKFTMKQYKPAPPVEALDTCYDFTGQAAIVIPGVTFKFSDGAIFDLSFDGIMLFPDDTTPAIGCLGFAARPRTMPFTIVGNTQQRNTEVIYDVGAEKIGFVPGMSC